MRLIVYIDMNAFFVSCHQAIKPKLKDKVVIVASDSRRAVVCSASYEAREYQIKSGMPLYQALINFPHAICVNVNRSLYVKNSAAILHLLKQKFNERVEQCSIDEFCFDITDIYAQFGSPFQCAEKIQALLKAQLDLPCSIGISFTKDLAKIASKLNKPQGIASLLPEELPSKLWPLAVDKLNGIGPKTNEKLQAINILTIGDLVNKDNETILNTTFGKRYLSWIRQATGHTTDIIDDNQNQTYKSIGRDYTLEYNSNNLKFLKTIFRKITNQVISEVLEKELVIKTLVCGYKVERTHWKTKQVAWVEIIDEDKIYEEVLNLFAKIWKPTLEVRALRVAVKIKN